MFIECAILVSMNRGLVIAGMMKLTAGTFANHIDGSLQGHGRPYKVASLREATQLKDGAL
jgi:hypothetical protein